MTELKSLMVVVSLDERDAATLDVACWLAGLCQLRSLTLVHLGETWSPPPYWPADSSDAPLGSDERGVETQLEQLVEQIRPRVARDTAIEALIRRGSLLAELIRLERECAADLVIVGRSDQTGYDRMTESLPSLVRKLPCSLLSVPSGVRTPLDRLLVPIDFSDLSWETLQLALRIAERNPGTSITAQHVYSVPIGYHKLGQTHEQFAASMRSLAENHWREWIAGMDGARDRVAVRFDLADEVPAAILAAAEETDAQLIMLAGHGRTLPSGVLLGHTADVVCRRSPRPVLCLKKKGQVVHLLDALRQLFTETA